MPVLEVINGFGPAAARGSLDLLACTITESLDNNDSLSARIAWPTRVPLQLRTVVRLTEDSGRITEWRVNRLTVSENGQPWAEITGAPPLHDFATAGIIRDTVGGRVVTEFSGEMSLTSWLNSRMMSSLPSPLNAWLDTTLGTIDSDPVIRLEWSQWTYLEFVRALQGTTFEIALERQAGGLYRLAFYHTRGSTAPITNVARGRNLLSRSSDSDDQDVASVVIPLGDAPTEEWGPSTIADNVWRVGSVLASGWVTLEDIDGSAGPVAFDDQFVGGGAGWVNANSTMVRATILDSRVSDGAIQLSSTTGLAVGSLLTLYSTSLGAPLIEVSNPGLVATDVGRVEKTISVAGGRGERNFNANPLMAQNVTGYRMGDHGVIMARSKLGQSVSLTANGSRAANTATTTPLAVDGLVPLTDVIYEGDRIDINGRTMFVTADAIPSPSGALTLTVNVGLPGTLPDGAPLTFLRRRRRVFTVSGTQNVCSRGLLLNAGGDEDGWPMAGLVLGMSDGRGNELRYGALKAADYPYQLTVFDAGSGKRRIVPISYIQNSSIMWSPVSPGVYNSLTFYNWGYDTATSRWYLVSTEAQATLIPSMIVGTTVANFGGYTMNLNAVEDGTIEGDKITWWTFDTSTLLPGEPAVNGSTYIIIWPSVMWSNVTIPNGATIEVYEYRETRTLLLNGSHAVNATTLNFKPVTELARRDFIAGDTISLLRNPVTVTMRVTSVSAVQVTEYGPGGEEYTFFRHTITLDLAASNIDELPTSDWLYKDLFFISTTGASAQFQPTPLSGNTMIFGHPEDLRTPGQLLREVWQGTPTTITSTDAGVWDDYTVSSGGAWGTNGRVTLGVTIPAGRSYAAQRPVVSNFLRPLNRQTSPMKLVNAVTGPASSVLIEGWDTIHYQGNVDINGNPQSNNVAVYRIKGDTNQANQSNIPIQGDVLYVSETVVANGSGQANITLLNPNIVAIANDQVLTLQRNPGTYPGEPTSGNGVRLLGPTWKPGSDPWTHLPDGYIEFYPGMISRQLTASVWFIVNFNNGNQPQTIPLQIAILNAANTPLATANVAQFFGTGSAQLIKITTQCTITSPGWYHIGVQGGAYANRELFIAVRSILAAGPSTDVPFIEGSWANRLLKAGNTQLLARQREKRSITATLAEFVAATGAVPSAASLTPGASFQFEDQNETLRLFAVTRDVINPRLLTLNLESLQRTVARLLGAGAASSTSGSGSAITVSGGGGGGGGNTVVNNTVGLTLFDDTGASVADVRTIDIAGITLASNGSNRATLTVTPEPDVTSADSVISGGDWVSRDLNTLSYQITITAGSGSLAGRTIRWRQTTVTCPAANGLIYVNTSGQVLARAAGSPETLPNNDELLLWRTFVDIPTYGQRIYAIVDSRTWGRLTPRAPLYIKQRIEAAKITSGAWAGATAVNDIGDINWYFANLGLYPFVEELPTQVLDHLNVQIAKFWGASGTGSTDWTALHGTTWAANFLRWPYDVGTPRGTPTKKRADSHDAYAGTFLRLAVRYAKTASGGLTWWDANYNDIKECFYRNIIQSQRSVNGGAGYMVETFQDPNVYPFCQTLDCIEAYRGLQDALDLMTSRGGAQATDAAYYQSWATNMLNGIRSQWSTTANANGETEWISVAWDNANSTRLVNNHQRWYPDLTMGVPAVLYGVDLHGTPSIARDRLAKLFERLNGKAPGWFYSRRYDLFPWGIVAAAATKVGYRDIGEAWLSYVQRHHANDAVGYLLVHDLGWARYIERLLGGEVL